ncbi:MAG: hypothetical protein QG597_4861 [Actinomycetota bacterium]|nr:hypothetical protein [Actinomycetota bacterium]
MAPNRHGHRRPPARTPAPTRTNPGAQPHEPPAPKASNTHAVAFVAQTSVSTQAVAQLLCPPTNNTDGFLLNWATLREAGRIWRGVSLDDCAQFSNY